MGDLTPGFIAEEVKVFSFACGRPPLWGLRSCTRCREASVWSVYSPT